MKMEPAPRTWQSLIQWPLEMVEHILHHADLNWEKKEDGKVQITYMIGHGAAYDAKIVNPHLNAGLRKILTKLGFNDLSQLKKCGASLNAEEGTVTITLAEEIQSAIPKRQSPNLSLRYDPRHPGSDPSFIDRLADERMIDGRRLGLNS